MTISLVLREGPSGKGTPLTNEEVDGNFVNLRSGIQTEQTSREQSISNLEDAIQDETTTRQTAISNLQTSIASEATSRIASDQNLQTQITLLQSSLIIEGYVQKTGSTLTGDIVFSESATSESNKVVFNSGTDSSSVHFISTGEGSDESGKSLSNLTISLLGEGDEGFLVRTTDALEESTDVFYVNTNLLKYKTNKIWHEGNDGAGSGLDADTLDGLQATAFASAVHNHDALYYTKSQIDSTFYSKTESASLFYTKDFVDLNFAPVSHTHAYQAESSVLTDIANADLSAAEGLFRKTLSGWILDNSSSNASTYENGSVTTLTQTSSTGDPITLDQFDVNIYRSARYTIQATSGSDFHVTEVLVLQNGTDAFITEFGTLTSNGTLLITVSPSVDSGFCSIVVTPTTATNTIIKSMRSALFA